MHHHINAFLLHHHIQVLIGFESDFVEVRFAAFHLSLYRLIQFESANFGWRGLILRWRGKGDGW